MVAVRGLSAFFIFLTGEGLQFPHPISQVYHDVSYKQFGCPVVFHGRYPVNVISIAIIFSGKNNYTPDEQNVLFN